MAKLDPNTKKVPPGVTKGPSNRKPRKGVAKQKGRRPPPRQVSSVENTDADGGYAANAGIKSLKGKKPATQYR